MLAVGFPMVLSNGLVGQNGFLTAGLIGGTLYLLPSGRCCRASASGSSPTSRNMACCFRSC